MNKIIITTIIAITLYGCNGDHEAADAYGNFEAIEVYVSSEVNGKLLELPVQEGSNLDIGREIAFIDSTQLVLQRDQLKAGIKALKSKLQDIPLQLNALIEKKKFLEQEISRVRSLLADSAATRKQLDDLVGERDVVGAQIAAQKSQLSIGNQSLLAEIESRELQVRQVQDQVVKSIIRSPMSGVVLERFKEPGEFVGIGQPVIKLADMSQLILRGYVSGDQLSSIKLGQEVSVRVDSLDGNMKLYKARISWIASKAEFTPKIIQTKEERVNLVYAIKVMVENDGWLKIGMPAEINF